MGMTKCQQTSREIDRNYPIWENKINKDHDDEKSF